MAASGRRKNLDLQDQKRIWKLGGLNAIVTAKPDVDGTLRLFDLLEAARLDQTIAKSATTIRNIDWIIELLEQTTFKDSPGIVAERRAVSSTRKAAAKKRHQPSEKTRIEVLRLHDTLAWQNWSASKVAKSIKADIKIYAKRPDVGFRYRTETGLGRTIYTWLLDHRKALKSK